MLLVVPWLMPSGSAKAFAANDHYLGQIKLFPYGKTPDGWLYCNGQTIPISQNTALFSLIGTMYGGDGSTVFAVPDLRGKEPAGGMGYYIATSGFFPSQGGAGAPYDVFLGEIQLFPYAFVPSGFVKASGQVLAISVNSALFSLFGTSYGGNGSSTFQLPNMKPLDDAGVFYAMAIAGIFPSTDGPGTDMGHSGEIGLFAYPSPNLAQGIMLDGRSLIRSEYPNLLASIGTRFGANDSATFKLPDLRKANPALLGGASFPTGFTIYQMLNGPLPSLSSEDAPVAHDDAFTTITGSLTVTAPGLLVNDSAASGVMVVKQPEHGAVSLDSNGAFVYAAAPTYQGADEFTYKAFSNWGSSVEATVRLTEFMPVITFAANGGTSVPSLQVFAGQAVEEPTAPTRTGYTFDGWYSDSAFSHSYDFSTQITADMTLYSKWVVTGEIVSAIERAEREQTQFAANAAAQLVLPMNDGPEKEALLSRLDIVQAVIDNRDLHLDQIVWILTKGTLAEKDLNGDQVFDAADVVIFLQRISFVSMLRF